LALSLPLVSTAVHPRASGEHTGLVGNIAIPRGSSPRERGTRPRDEAQGFFERFIPARAGNTAKLLAVTMPVTVHPRASGEHKSQPEFPEAQSGSSPRERGTHNAALLVGKRGRFIPARAGNTESHPCASSLLSGSSPRERGTPILPIGEGVDFRFIPARAGNTNPSAR